MGQIHQLRHSGSWVGWSEGNTEVSNACTTRSIHKLTQTSPKQKLREMGGSDRCVCRCVCRVRVWSAGGSLHLADGGVGVDDGGRVDEARGRVPRRSLRGTCGPPGMVGNPARVRVTLMEIS